MNEIPNRNLRRPAAPKLPRSWRNRMLRDLESILGVVPPVFSAPRMRVLKVGIKHDMVAHYGADPEKVDAWLRKWTSSGWYLLALSRKRHRHDLNGNDVDLIAVKHREHAGRMLKPAFPR